MTSLLSAVKVQSVNRHQSRQEDGTNGLPEFSRARSVFLGRKNKDFTINIAKLELDSLILALKT